VYLDGFRVLTRPFSTYDGSRIPSHCSVSTNNTALPLCIQLDTRLHAILGRFVNWRIPESFGLS
jgi:hypothetical protein